MSFAINPTQIPQAIESLYSGVDTKGVPGSFQGVLESIIQHSEKTRAAADQKATDFISGDNEELHTVALASQRAELEFDLLLQIRNKVVSAYQEIMRMQV